MIKTLRTFALSTIFISACYAGNSQLINGDFDEDMKGWNVPGGGSIDTVIYKTKEATGEGGINKSLKISSSISKGWDMATQNIDVEPGAVYLVELWVKFLNAKQTHVKVKWFDKNNKFIKNSFICPGSDGSKDWFKASQIIQAPDNAARARLAFLAGNGTSWFDAVKFVKTSSPIPHIGPEKWAEAARKKYGPEMAAHEMKEKIIYYDPRHDSAWVKNLKNIVDFFYARGFTVKNAADLKSWMQKKIKEGGDGTVCIMSMGIAPDNIIESMSTDCTIKKYMDAGGRIVWIGDLPLFYKSYVDKAPREWSLYGNSRKMILGISDGKRDIRRRTQVTDTGKKWGVRKTGTALRPIHNKSATLIFSEVADHSYACSYLKNYNIDFPYSGFIRYRASNFDGIDEELNEDLYRISLYRGKKIEIPEVKEVKKAVEEPLKVVTKFKNYPRGKDILISMIAEDSLEGKAIMILKDKNQKVIKSVSLFRDGKPYAVDTKFLAPGEYDIEIQVINNNKLVAKNETKIFLAPVKTPKFPIGMYGVMGGSSEYKKNVVLKDLKEHLGECGIISGKRGTINDLALRYGLRIMPVSNAYYRNLPSREANPELHMRVSTGKWPSYHYKGINGAPLCFGNAINRKKIGKFLAKEIKEFYKYPAFMDIMLFDDDVAMYGDPGEHLLACYCDNCKRKFKKLTGFDAPLAPSEKVLKNKGVVKDNDPWYLWMKFRTGNVYAGWNKAMEEAKDTVDPKIKLMPAIGGWDVFSPQWCLNPPDTYRDIDIISFYHYPQLSRPCIYFMSQAALGVMGNRNKDYWCIPQASDYAHVIKDPTAHTMLVRNEFYYLIAAGAKGMGYFHYPPMPGLKAWEEFKNLSRFGTRFGQFLLNWKKQRPETAILTSYCNASYQWAAGGSHSKESEKLYISLLKDHVSTDMIADEEILAGDLDKYKTLLLVDIDYLTESIYGKIEEFIKNGGTVFCDSDCFLKFSGSKISETSSWSSELKKINGNMVDIDTPDLIFSEFKSGGARYLMLVNGRTDKAVAGKTTLKGIGKSAIYDLSEGRLLSSGGNCAEFEVKLEAAGGKLIGIYPAEIKNISILSPKKMFRGKEYEIKVEIRDENSKIIKGLFPLKATVKNPAGERSEYSDFYAAKNGALNFSFAPAVNDLAGEWELEVSELSSGVSGKTSFILE